MKKIFAILSAAAVALTMMVSCQEKEEPHVPGQPDVENCYGIFFPVQDATGYHIYDPAAPLTATFTVGRSNTAGAITVPVVVDASEEIFEIAPVTFADGQAETTFKVDFPNVEDGKEYSLHIEVTDPQYASIYSNKTTFMDFSFMRVEMLDFLNPKTKEPAEITLNEGWWGEVHKAKMKYYEVNDVRTCTIYSIEEGNGIWGDTVDATLQFKWYTKVNNSEDNNILEVPKQYMGFDYDGWGSKPVEQATSPVYVYDYYSYWIERGESESTLGTFLQFAANYGNPDGSYPIGYYDGNGGFFFNLRYYIPGLGGFSPDPYEFVAIVDGFTRVDYSLKLEAGLTESGATPVAVTAGADVASVKYAVYEGVLTGIQVSNRAAEIEADANAAVFSALVLNEDTEKKEGIMALTPEATGEYTLVALAVDKDGKVQNTASANFTFVSTENPVPVVISAGLEKTGKYAKDGFTTENSLEFYIYGENIVDAKVGVFKYIDIASNGTDKIAAAVKAGSSLKAEAIAAINGSGYVDIASGLMPGTEFYLVVWASNGYEETTIFSEGATTDGDPLPIYQDYSTADYYEAGELANREAFIGKWNYYGLDVYGNLGLREYLGKVDVTASDTPTEGPDGDGLYDEYVNVTGLFGDLSWLANYSMSTNATVELDVYAGIAYNYLEDTKEGDYKVYLGAKAQDSWGYTLPYGSAFIPVADGYYAFVDVSKYAASYNFCGLGLLDEANGWIAKIWDPLLVDPAKDDNGVAPASVAAAKQLFQDIAAAEPDFGVQPKQRMRNIIDKYNLARANKFAPAGLEGLELSHRQVKVSVTSRSEMKFDNKKSNRELVANPVR